METPTDLEKCHTIPTLQSTQSCYMTATSSSIQQYSKRKWPLQSSVVPLGIVAIENIFVHRQLQIRNFFTHPPSQTATY